jgi:hypothetical protein
MSTTYCRPICDISKIWETLACIYSSEVHALVLFHNASFEPYSILSLHLLISYCCAVFSNTRKQLLHARKYARALLLMTNVPYHIPDHGWLTTWSYSPSRHTLRTLQELMSVAEAGILKRSAEWAGSHQLYIVHDDERCGSVKAE